MNYLAHAEPLHDTRTDLGWLKKLSVKYKTDEALRAKIDQDPRSYFVEQGMTLDRGIDVKVVQDTGDLVHVVLPRASKELEKISQSDLGSIVGGATSSAGSATSASTASCFISCLSTATSLSTLGSASSQE